MRLREVGGVLVVVLALFVDLLVWGGVRQLRSGGTLPLGVIPVLTTAVYSLLLLRWRRPVPVFAAQWVYGLAGLLVPGYGPFAGLLMAVHAVACRTSGRTAAVALAGCAVPFGIDCFIAADQRIHVETSFVVSFAAQFFLYMILTITVWGLGRLSYTTERRSQRMQQQQAAEAVRAERLRVARELHDIVAHAVSVMLLQAAGARALVGTEDEQVRQSLAVIEGSGVEAMTELHRLLGLLRSVDPAKAEADYTRQPQLEDIAALVEVSRASGLDVETVTDGHPGRLDASVDLAAYRLVQEALTNTHKHAGHGAAVRIHLHWHLDHLTITVRDISGLMGGKTRSASLSSGHGLEGLTERVNLVGGRLDVGPVQGGGFLVRAELPISAASRSSRTLAEPGTRAQ